MAASTADEKYALIADNLAEVINPEIIKDILARGDDLKVYWGTATTGRPHCGYMVPAMKLAQLVKAGCHVTILLADIHGFLDNLKAPLELVEYRAQYYKYAMMHLFKAVGVSLDKVKFVLGSSYQKSEKYCLDVYKLCSLVSEHDAKKAGSEIVKQSNNAPLSSLLYPLLQVLDEEYLEVDCQLGGLDQRKLFTAAKEWLPKLGYRERAHLCNPMVPGLKGSKMSASDPDSKIDLLDSAEVVTKKIRKADAIPKVTEENGILAFVEFVLLPAGTLKYGHAEFRVERERDGLEPLIYTTRAQLDDDYKNDVLTPQLLKPAVSKALNDLLAPIQAAYQADPQWQEITEKAYPPPEKAKKKEKKVKDKGSRHPGGAKGPATEATTDLPIRPAAEQTETQ